MQSARQQHETACMIAQCTDRVEGACKKTNRPTITPLPIRSFTRGCCHLLPFSLTGRLKLMCWSIRPAFNSATLNGRLLSVLHSAVSQSATVGRCGMSCWTCRSEWLQLMHCSFCARHDRFVSIPPPDSLPQHGRKGEWVINDHLRVHRIHGADTLAHLGNKSDQQISSPSPTQHMNLIA